MTLTDLSIVKKKKNKMTKNYTALSAEAIEYTNCISAEG